MAIIEIQFHENVFFEILRAQIVRFDIPPSLFPELSPVPPPVPELVVRRIERIDAGPAGFADPNGPVQLPDPGQLLFKVAFDIRHTSFADARAAGFLQPPATQTIPCVVWVQLGGEPPATITWWLRRLEVSGQFRPILLAPGTFPLGDLGLTTQSVALVAGANVVALRFGTQANDNLLSAVENRLFGADWGQFIEGQVFGEELAHQMNSAVDDAVKGSSDPPLRIDSHATGGWVTSPPRAVAAVDLTAVGAFPVIGTNVPVAIYASTNITADLVLEQLVLLTKINWFAHDVITVGSGGAIQVIQSKVSDAVLSKLKAPAGQTEVDRSDDHVTYRNTRAIAQPTTPLFRTQVTSAGVDDSGVHATGTVTVYPPPVAFFTFEGMRWSGGLDCSVRGWRTKFVPAAVHIFSPDRYYDLQIRSVPLVQPAGIWNPTVGWTGFGPGIQVADIVFARVGALPPVGTPSSAYLDTNMGVRYVELGGVPREPDPPANQIAFQAYAISECMAISDRWGMGVLNLEWIPDPPERYFGHDPVREWTLAAEQVVDAERIELVATGPSGERQLPPVTVVEGTLFAQVITRADELLQVRTPVRTVGSAPPTVMQRWITPWARVPVESGMLPVAAADQHLWLASSGAVRQMSVPVYQPTDPSPSAPAVRNEPSNVPQLVREVIRTGVATSLGPRTIGVGRVVAALDGGSLVVGLAGGLVSVEVSH